MNLIFELPQEAGELLVLGFQRLAGICLDYFYHCSKWYRSMYGFTRMLYVVVCTVLEYLRMNEST